MPRTAVATSTRSLHEHLGRDMLALARAVIDEMPVITYDDQIAFGRQIAGMVKAAHKAVIAGKQSDKQIKAAQEKAQQAFARSLRRAAKKATGA